MLPSRRKASRLFAGSFTGRTERLPLGLLTVVALLIPALFLFQVGNAVFLYQDFFFA